MTRGAIRVERCTSHVYVEWSFKADISKWERDHYDVSPRFEIGDRSYSLQSHTKIRWKYFNFSLSRVGPPLRRSVGWWAGLKFPDRYYAHAFGRLGSREEYLDLLRVHDLDCFLRCFGESRESLSFTLCFQLQVEEESAGTETCIHYSPEKMFPPSDGQIYEKECSCLKHVEWTLDFDWNRQNWVSSVFETADQRFRFVFSWNGSRTAFSDLKLYWLGPSVGDPGIFVRCWAGLKRFDGTYHLKDSTHIFFVEEKSWNPHIELMRVTSEEIANHLDRNKRLAFFLRINEETGAKPCDLGHPEEFPRGVGSIQQELWSPYVLVQWTFSIDNNSEVSSPVFVVDNQNYVMSLEDMPHVYVKTLRLSLSRKGPFADRHVRYLGVLRRSDDLYEDLCTRHGQLNLRKTADLWFREASISELQPPETWEEFTVDLLLTCDESPAAGTPCFSPVSEAEEDSPEMDPSFVVFKVEGTAFKVHRAPILVCVPVFQIMLTHECVETKTGVVTIKDCKAVVFKEFLESVEVGFQRRPSAENALALYEVAHKYLLSRYKFQCTECIIDSLSLDNIIDVLELAFAYEDKRLIRVTCDFLSRNFEIIERDDLCSDDVFSRYPAILTELRRTMADLYLRIVLEDSF